MSSTQRVTLITDKKIWNAKSHIWKTLGKSWPKFENNPKILHAISNKFWCWKKLFWMINSKNQNSNLLEESLDYLSILYKMLFQNLKASYEETNNKDAAKNIF